MRIVARKVLKEFSSAHSRVEASLNSWYYEVKHADWIGPADIKRRYPSASFLRDNRVIFNISGYKYRLLCRVRYDAAVVYILLVGTHSEYDRIDAETYRYHS